MGTHAGIVNRARAQHVIDPIEATDVCAQKTSIGFVNSIFEILGPLLAGARLVVLSAAAGRDVDALASVIERTQVTRLITVPSLADAMEREAVTGVGSRRSAAGRSAAKPSVRSFCSGFGRRYPGCTFINLYGSSEVAADATGYVTGRLARQSASRSVARCRTTARTSSTVPCSRCRSA